MALQSFPLPIAGVTAQNRSPQANNEQTKNWFPQVMKNNGITQVIMLPWFGASAFGTSAGTADRGLWVWQDTLYHVVNQTLYSVDNVGTYTSIGTISGTQRCVFSNSKIGSSDVMVIAAGNVYTYDGTTLADSGLDADAVTYLNSKSIYPNGGFEFAVSGAGGPTSITSTGSAESSPDNLLRPYAFNQWVYMFGERTIEPFYDNGASSGVPFSRIDNAIMQKGLGGFYTIANTDRALYFLADDSNVYQIIQSQLTKITPPWIVNKIKDLNHQTASGYTLTLNGQDFYVLWFASGVSYAYIEQLDEWINLSSGTSNGPYLGSSYARVYQTDIVADYRTGNTVELTLEERTELGEPIQRRRVTPPFTSKDVGLPYGKRLLMSHVKFALQTGQGIVSGQGENPKIMVEASLDGGQTWSTERWVEVGRMGDYIINCEYWEMLSFYEICFRITISDPVFSSLHEGTIFLKQKGY